MVNLSCKKKVVEVVNNWLTTMETGDTIRFNGASLVFYNASGSELDSVDVFK